MESCIFPTQYSKTLMALFRTFRRLNYWFVFPAVQCFHQARNEARKSWTKICILCTTLKGLFCSQITAFIFFLPFFLLISYLIFFQCPRRQIQQMFPWSVEWNKQTLIWLFFLFFWHQSRLFMPSVWRSTMGKLFSPKVIGGKLKF